MSARLIGSGQAFPTTISQDDIWDGFFAGHYAESRQARRIFRGAGVRTRHAAVDPRQQDVSGWSTGARMRAYAELARPLGAQAAAAALADSGCAADEIGLFAVTTCTGYATPGLDIRLADELGLSADVQRLAIGHMGCYAALPSLGAVADYTVAHQRPSLLLCVELTSLHVQPPTEDAEQVVSHALFSDAAAAVVLAPDDPVGSAAPAGLSVLDVVARTDASTAGHMTWDVTDLGFRMGLSRHVADVLDVHVADVVKQLLHRNGLDVAAVRGWAVHPGGPRILDVVQRRLGLSDSQLEPSRGTLAEHGNASSPTVLLVLEQVRAAGVSPGEYVVALAFGPGLTLYGVLLRAG